MKYRIRIELNTDYTRLLPDTERDLAEFPITAEYNDGVSGWNRSETRYNMIYLVVFYHEQEKIPMKVTRSRAEAFRYFNSTHCNVPMGIETDTFHQIAYKEGEI